MPPTLMQKKSDEKCDDKHYFHFFDFHSFIANSMFLYKHKDYLLDKLVSIYGNSNLFDDAIYVLQNRGKNCNKFPRKHAPLSTLGTRASKKKIKEERNIIFFFSFIYFFEALVPYPGYPLSYQNVITIAKCWFHLPTSLKDD